MLQMRDEAVAAAAAAAANGPAKVSYPVYFYTHALRTINLMVMFIVNGQSH